MVKMANFMFYLTKNSKKMYKRTKGPNNQKIPKEQDRVRIGISLPHNETSDKATAI